MNPLKPQRSNRSLREALLNGIPLGLDKEFSERLVKAQTDELKDFIRNKLNLILFSCPNAGTTEIIELLDELVFRKEGPQ
jgi:hypothetical protein